MKDPRSKIPDLLTIGNLLMGCLAIVKFTEEAFIAGSLLIGLAAFLDLLDGAVARMIGASSEIGAELDSLADIVSFGVAPAFLVKEIYSLLNERTAVLAGSSFPEWPGYLAFVIPLLSAVRLARFNVDEGGKGSFTGLPTPAHAILWAGLPPLFLQIFTQEGFRITETIRGLEMERTGALLEKTLLFPPFYAIAPVLTAFLMIASFSMFKLTFSASGQHSGKAQWIFIGIAVLSLPILRLASFSPLVLVYIIISMLTRSKWTDRS